MDMNCTYWERVCKTRKGDAVDYWEVEAYGEGGYCQRCHRGDIRVGPVRVTNIPPQVKGAWRSFSLSDNLHLDLDLASEVANRFNVEMFPIFRKNAVAPMAMELIPHRVATPWIDRDWLLRVSPERHSREAWWREECSVCGGERWLWPGDDVFEHMTMPCDEVDGWDLVASVERFGAGWICNSISMWSDGLGRFLHERLPRTVPLVNSVGCAHGRPRHDSPDESRSAGPRC